jgi:DNA-binding response OmpR family regulator
MGGPHTRRHPMTETRTEGREVLVVEDDEHIARLLQFMLQRGGYRVTLRQDGRAAQAHIEQEAPPALVLLDFMLPHVDGLELLALLRARPAWQGVPVLMLTGKADKAYAERARAAGADDYIQKPFLPDAVMARVKALAPLQDPPPSAA